MGRPLTDRLEVAAPSLAALAARGVAHLPPPLRDRALRGAFDRARDAFNRGDFETVFALFEEDVEYVPPPALHEGEPLHGRDAVLAFWRDIVDRYPESTIENLSLEQAAPGLIVRRARLRHRSATDEDQISYEIVQTTELVAGRVVRQVNAPADEAPRLPPAGPA